MHDSYVSLQYRTGTEWSSIDYSRLTVQPTNLVQWNMAAANLAAKNKGRTFRLVWSYRDGDGVLRGAAAEFTCTGFEQGYYDREKKRTVSYPKFKYTVYEVDVEIPTRDGEGEADIAPVPSNPSSVPSTPAPVSEETQPAHP